MMLSDVWRLSVCLMSVAYIGPKSRTERPRKTKIGTEVAHVTRDLDTTFKIKRSKVKVTGAGHIVAAPAQLVVLANRPACLSFRLSVAWYCI